jgi:hypothetical protein
VEHRPYPATPRRFSGILLIAGLTAIAASILCSLGQLWITARHFPLRWSDMVPVVMGTQEALHHQGPYAANVTDKIQISFYGHVLRPGEEWDTQAFAYPAHSVFFFAPFALLPWPVARLLATCLMPPLVGFAAWLWTGLARTPYRVPFTVAAVLSWPAMASYASQQPTVPIFAAITLGCWLLHRNRNFAAGMVLAAATIKPQLCFLLLPWLACWAIVHRRYSFFAGFGATLATLLAAAQWLVPGWFPLWRAAATHYATGQHQPILIQFLGAGAGTVCIALLAAFTLYALLRIGLRDRHAMPRAAALLFALTLSMTPANLWQAYNYLLLLPALLQLVHSHRARRSRNLTLAAYAWMWLAAPLGVALYAAFGYHLWLASLPFWNFFLPQLATIALCFRELPSMQSARRPVPMQASPSEPAMA